ncbi:MAG TPA: ABC transporter permease subunit [Opitutaceae bacterium]|nr:ABC transporter permease subunit [Opitutaceae bacterium]
MIRFVFQRLLQTIPVIWIIVTATFFMIRFVPGGPFTAEKAVTPEILRNLEAHYGMNRPLYRQYIDYTWSLLRGDLGPSFKYPTRSVNEIIAEKLPVSVELGLLSLAVALGTGIPLGVLAAVRRNTWMDYVCSSVAMVGICVPTFVMGPIAILVFAIHLGQFNASGWYGPIDRVLPSLTLGLVYAAYIARLTRGGMLEVLSQDYIRTARAKGASESRVVIRHALRGGLSPVVSFLGPAIAGIVTGSFVIETVFQIPGIGREFINSATNRDYTLVLGTVILYAGFLIAMNLMADIALVWLNPKLKFE